MTKYLIAVVLLCSMFTVAPFAGAEASRWGKVGQMFACFTLGGLVAQKHQDDSGVYEYGVYEVGTWWRPYETDHGVPAGHNRLIWGEAFFVPHGTPAPYGAFLRDDRLPTHLIRRTEYIPRKEQGRALGYGVIASGACVMAMRRTWLRYPR